MRSRPYKEVAQDVKVAGNVYFPRATDRSVQPFVWLGHRGIRDAGSLLVRPKPL